MNLLICHAYDMQALWLYAHLMRLGAKVELVNADALPCALQWNYRIGGKESGLDILLANHKWLTTDNIGLVINRIGAVNPVGWKQSDPVEQQYVMQEMHSFFFSWLYTLSRETILLNPPGGNGLAGHYYSIPEWINYAYRAGLPVGDYAENTRDSDPPASYATDNSPNQEINLLIVKDKIFGIPVPAEIARACKKLPSVSGNEMLEIVLEKQHGWRFKRASPFPAFSLYGTPFVNYISTLLT